MRLTRSACLWRTRLAAAVTATAGAAGADTSGSCSGERTLAEETRRRLRARDITLRVPSKDASCRVVFCSSRNLLLETTRRHRLLRATRRHAPFLRLLGTHLTFTNLLAALQDGEERVEVRFTGDEATIVAEALALGECRAYLRPEYNAQLTGNAAEKSLMPFPLIVARVLYNQHNAFKTTVNARLDELAGCSDARVQEQIQRVLAESHTAPAVTSGTQPPLALGLDEAVDAAALEEYFTHNIALHGYNYFRRSDGCSVALTLQTAVDQTLLDSVPEEEDAAAAAAAAAPDSAGELTDALRSALPFSYGALVQPLAEGNALTWAIWRVQRAMTIAAVQCNAEHASVPSVVPSLGVLRVRAAQLHTACQDTLTLLTGDVDGAYEAAMTARQHVEEPAKVAAIVEPIRAALGISDVRIELDGKAANRTAVDFFCRCSTAGILQSLLSVPDETLEKLRQDNEFRCTFCGAVHRPSAREWDHLLEVRRARRG